MQHRKTRTWRLGQASQQFNKTPCSRCDILLHARQDKRRASTRESSRSKTNENSPERSTTCTMHPRDLGECRFQWSEEHQPTRRLPMDRQYVISRRRSAWRWSTWSCRPWSRSSCHTSVLILSSLRTRCTGALMKWRSRLRPSSTGMLRRFHQWSRQLNCRRSTTREYNGIHWLCKHYTSKYRKMATETLHENNGFGFSAMRTSVRRITASSQTTSGMTWTTTSSSPSTTPMTTLTHCTCTSTDAWRTCTESARTAHLPQFMMTPHTSWLKFWAHSHFHLHGHPWRILLDSTSPFFFYLFLLSVPVFLFHLELFLELHYTIVMASLRCSAAEESEDTLNAFTLTQVMSPTSWPSASSTTHQSPSPSWSLPRTRTWMTWHSARCSQRHIEDKSTTVYQACQSVSQSSVMFDGSGQPDGERMVDQSGKSDVTFNVIGAHSTFSEDIQIERMVDRSGQPDEWNSSNAQIRTLLEEQRQTIIAEYREKVGHHELQAAHAEEERRLLQGQLWRQKLEFREARQQSLTEMEELRKFQSSTFDTIARRKLIEDQNTILELSGRVQELQNEVNCMNDSKDFQDAESVRSGNFHVTSRPVSFPPHPNPGGMLSRSFGVPSRREGPPSIWDTHGISGNVFADPHASSSAPYPQELNQWNSSIEEPLHSSTVEKSKRPEQNQDLRCQSGPSAKDSVIFSGGDSLKNYGADQQRLQILDLHFDKFPTPATFACWKIRFKTEVCTWSQFPTEAMQWIKEVEIRHLYGVFQCRILKYLMRGLLQRWTKSSIILTSKE